MKIIIDKEEVKEDTLLEFIDALQNALPGCHVKMQEVFILDTDDPKAGAVLQSIFGGTGASSFPKAEQIMKREKPVKERRQQVHYEILSGSKTGSEFTGASLALMLKAGNIEAGTRLRHPEKGEMTIVKDENSGLIKLVPMERDKDE